MLRPQALAFVYDSDRLTYRSDCMPDVAEDQGADGKRAPSSRLSTARMRLRSTCRSLAYQIPSSCFFLASKSSAEMMPWSRRAASRSSSAT